MSKAPRERRVPIMLAESELGAIDEWGWENRFATRAAAIRRLCAIGLTSSERETMRPAPGTHTETEARTKWCPHARRAVGFDSGRVAANRWDGNNALCLASGCMAWIAEEPIAPGLNEEPRGRCGLVGRGG